MKFGNRSGEPKPRGGEVSGFFGEGIEIRGDLRFKETVRIDGRVNATIRSEGELVLGPSGIIEGEITVGSLSVSGRVKGTIRVKDRLEVHPGGRIEGEVLLGRPGLIVHDGGVIEAQIQMGTTKQATEPSPGMAKQPEKRAVAVQGTV
jgi:cytoskeletal protein CcmA (bactofilin family)